MAPDGGEIPVSYAFRPFQDVLPGKGEWFKRNNLFFRETVGVYSDRYDLCAKVADKRAIARSVVQAVYDNGGRFLDAEGQEVDIRRSMDKAMKALKDRRHIKMRQRLSARGIKPKQVAMEKERRKLAQGILPAKPVDGKQNVPPQMLPSLQPRPQGGKDPLTTTDASRALLLLRNASQGISCQAGPVGTTPLPGINFTALPGTQRPPELYAPALPIAGRAGNPGNQSAQVKKKKPKKEKSFLDASDDSDSDDSAPTSPERAMHSTQGYHGGLASLAAISSLTSEAMGLLQNRGVAQQEQGNTMDKTEAAPPVVMQSVIVSREAPQASMADLLNNAKLRLDALSSIQQAVAAPICLIYPPSPGLLVQSAGLQQQHYFQPQNSPSLDPP